jgi:hypothetical protein
VLLKEGIFYHVIGTAGNFVKPASPIEQKKIKLNDKEEHIKYNI